MYFEIVKKNSTNKCYSKSPNTGKTYDLPLNTNSDKLLSVISKYRIFILIDFCKKYRIHKLVWSNPN